MTRILVAPGGPIERAAAVASAMGGSLTVAPQAVAAFALAAERDADGAWAVARPLHHLLEAVVAHSPRPWFVDEPAARHYIAAARTEAP
jgi:hypothetical protein